MGSWAVHKGVSPEEGLAESEEVDVAACTFISGWRGGTFGFETGGMVDGKRRGEGVADKSGLSFDGAAASVAPWQNSRWVSMSFLLIMDLLHRGQ